MFEKELRVVKEKSLMKSIVSERFSMDFLSHQSDKFDDNLWGAVCRYQNLTEEYIETFKHEVDWKSISSCQKLSIKFIEDNLDKIDLHNIGPHNQLPFEFIVENLFKFKFSYLLTSMVWCYDKIHYLIKSLYKQEFVVHNSSFKDAKNLATRLEDYKDNAKSILSNGAQIELPFNYPFYKVDVDLRDLYIERLVINMNLIIKRLSE